MGRVVQGVGPRAARCELATGSYPADRKSIAQPGIGTRITNVCRHAAFGAVRPARRAVRPVRFLAADGCVKNRSTRKHTYESRCATRHRRRAAQDDERLFGGGAGFFCGITRRSSAQVRNAASPSEEGGAFRAAARIRIMRANRLTTGGLVRAALYRFRGRDRTTRTGDDGRAGGLLTTRRCGGRGICRGGAGGRCAAHDASKNLNTLSTH